MTGMLMNWYERLGAGGVWVYLLIYDDNGFQANVFLSLFIGHYA